MPNIFKDKESFERFKERTYASQSPFQSKYWYVLGYDKKGEKHIVGPYYTASEADRILVGFDDGETFELRTRDKAKATAEIKAELLARETPPDDALKRVSHKLPMESPRERRLRRLSSSREAEE